MPSRDDRRACPRAGMWTSPPSATISDSAASVSSTPKYTTQCDGAPSGRNAVDVHDPGERARRLRPASCSGTRTCRSSCACPSRTRRGRSRLTRRSRACAARTTTARPARRGRRSPGAHPAARCRSPRRPRRRPRPCVRAPSRPWPAPSPDRRARPRSRPSPPRRRSRGTPTTDRVRRLAVVAHAAGDADALL